MNNGVTQLVNTLKREHPDKKVQQRRNEIMPFIRLVTKDMINEVVILEDQQLIIFSHEGAVYHVCWYSQYKKVPAIIKHVLLTVPTTSTAERIYNHEILPAQEPA